MKSLLILLLGLLSTLSRAGDDHNLFNLPPNPTVTHSDWHGVWKTYHFENDGYAEEYRNRYTDSEVQWAKRCQFKDGSEVVMSASAPLKVRETPEGWLRFDYGGTWFYREEISSTGQVCVLRLTGPNYFGCNKPTQELGLLCYGRQFWKLSD